MTNWDYVYLWMARKEWRRSDRPDGAYITITRTRPFGMNGFVVAEHPSSTFVIQRKPWATNYWLGRLNRA